MTTTTTTPAPSVSIFTTLKNDIAAEFATLEAKAVASVESASGRAEDYKLIAGVLAKVQTFLAGAGDTSAANLVGTVISFLGKAESVDQTVSSL